MPILFHFPPFEFTIFWLSRTAVLDFVSLFVFLFQRNKYSFLLHIFTNFHLTQTYSHTKVFITFPCMASRSKKLFQISDKGGQKEDEILKRTKSNITKAELTFLQNKKYQALVVRARLKRMSCEATNIVQELRAEDLWHVADRHIASATSLNGQRRTTNKTICRKFRDYFEKLFTRNPGLSSVQFDTYLANFSRLAATEAAGFEGCIRMFGKRLKRLGQTSPPGSLVSPTKCTWGWLTCSYFCWRRSITTGWNRAPYPDASPGI